MFKKYQLSNYYRFIKLALKNIYIPIYQLRYILKDLTLFKLFYRLSERKIDFWHSTRLLKNFTLY